jgi:hypothetical protein
LPAEHSNAFGVEVVARPYLGLVNFVVGDVGAGGIDQILNVAIVSQAPQTPSVDDVAGQ